MTTIQSTDLEFNTIKSRLKTYLQQQSEFADYDFEASGLSNILDVLAYNTHINGLIANFALNESFLSTAQLRSSVVSHAEVLGYTPRSQTSARATVNIAVNITAVDRPNLISLPEGTTFTSSVDGVTKTFRTLEEYTATDDGSGEYNFTTSTGTANIEIVEGTQRTKTFLVGDTTDGQIYVIPDNTMDTTTIKVDVYETASDAEPTDVYVNINRAVRINSTSKVYQIKEVPNGYHEIVFGDGSVLGAAPVAGNKLVVTYLSTSAEDGNGASTFIPTADLTVSVGGTDIEYPLLITTVSGSAGGSDKESISSIKQNAVIAFASQQRMVTALDYQAQILANYSEFVDDVIAWGGNQNQPPIYGRTYVSLKFIDGLTDDQKQTVKDQIVTNLTDNLAVMSIDTVFSDPTTAYLELKTFFNFDPDLTNLTVKSAQNTVSQTINSFFETNLKRFNSVFRRSSLLTEIDKISPAILNSRTDVKVQLRVSVTAGTASDYTIFFPMRISEPLTTESVVTSSRFTYNGTTCIITNVLGSTVLRVVDLSGTTQITNIGSYTPSNGRVQLLSFNPSAVTGNELKISVIPANQSTIRPLRNYILDIDTGVSVSTAQIDYQNTLTTLTT